MLFLSYFNANRKAEKKARRAKFVNVLPNVCTCSFQIPTTILRKFLSHTWTNRINSGVYESLAPWFYGFVPKGFRLATIKNQASTYQWYHISFVNIHQCLLPNNWPIRLCGDIFSFLNTFNVDIFKYFLFNIFICVKKLSYIHPQIVVVMTFSH